jgi:hypothetical protein
MLKTVSSIVNALGALNYKGTWNASTNSPALASGAGAKGDYYVVSVAGTTALDGISNWGVGDWATFNGSVWQRVEGGADLNGVNLSVSGASALAGNVTFSDNLTQGSQGKGVNFSANSNAPGMTSELLNWYEEGTWMPTKGAGLTVVGTFSSSGTYTRVGRLVTVTAVLNATTSLALNSTGGVLCGGLPYSGSGQSIGAGTNGAQTVAYSVLSNDTRLFGTTAIAASASLTFTCTYTV